jgi:mono/diheme cytochrome c family protein
MLKTLAFVLAITTPALAGHGVVVQQNVAVPFAVAVPVAVVAPGQGLYSLQSYVPQPQAQQADDTAKILEEFEAFLLWRKSRVQAQSRPSLLSAHCGRCHQEGGTGATVGKLGKFRLDQLTPESRGAAIAAVSLGTMPEDAKNLHPDIRLKIIAELSGATAKPPADPKPE